MKECLITTDGHTVGAACNVAPNEISGTAIMSDADAAAWDHWFSSQEPKLVRVPDDGREPEAMYRLHWLALKERRGPNILAEFTLVRSS